MGPVFIGGSSASEGQCAIGGRIVTPEGGNSLELSQLWWETGQEGRHLPLAMMAFRGQKERFGDRYDKAPAGDEPEGQAGCRGIAAAGL